MVLKRDINSLKLIAEDSLAAMEQSDQADVPVFDGHKKAVPFLSLLMFENSTEPFIS